MTNKKVLATQLLVAMGGLANAGSSLSSFALAQKKSNRLNKNIDAKETVDPLKEKFSKNHKNKAELSEKDISEVYSSKNKRYKY